MSGKTKLTQQVHSAAGAFAARENLLSEKRCDIRDFFSFRAKLYFAVPVIDRQLGCGNEFFPRKESLVLWDANYSRSLLHGISAQWYSLKAKKVRQIIGAFREEGNVGESARGNPSSYSMFSHIADEE